MLPRLLSVDVKYVQFSETVEPQDFSNTQHTPKLLAQEPLELPLYEQQGYTGTGSYKTDQQHSPLGRAF